MGLWEPMNFGIEERLPMHTWIPSRCRYEQKTGMYHLEGEPYEGSCQGTDGEQFRWELLLTVATASGFARYPKEQCSDPMAERYSYIVQCLRKVYAPEYPPLQERILGWLKEVTQHSGEQWNFCDQSRSYCRSHWEPVTQQEFDRIVKEVELSDTYFNHDDPTDTHFQIILKDCTVSLFIIDAGMGRADRTTYMYADREAALGHALELMRRYQTFCSTSPERKAKAEYQMVTGITVTPVRREHYWRCEIVLEHWCGRWCLMITDVFAKDKYNDAKERCRRRLPSEFPNMTSEELAAFINSIQPSGPGYCDGYRAVKPEEVTPLLEAARQI